MTAGPADTTDPEACQDDVSIVAREVSSFHMPMQGCDTLAPASVWNRRVPRTLRPQCQQGRAPRSQREGGRVTVAGPSHH